MEEQILHEDTLFAEPIFNIGNFSVTNSLINSWIVLIVVLIFAFSIRKKIRRVPRGMQNLLEVIIDWFLNLSDQVTGSRKVSLKVLPIVLSFFFFILLNNWLGLLPGIGSIGKIVMEDGQKVFVPFFRGATADLNTTLALASVALVIVHIFGTVAHGAWNYLNKFVNIRMLVDIPKKVFKDPTVLLINPVKIFVGLLEIIGEIAKAASLSFRLFGNIFAGEVLLSAMSAIFAFLVPLPFIALEIMVGLIQAMIFSILILIYTSVSMAPEEEEA
ncbi:MAG: F0F1 ATP synthase subunit A [Patescibacteria group bacterium]|jgi:F-type H+-transporting ATPase subunit a|nr:F0F1 ATP synthase subunit A [Patescibacteria group bacterium]